VKPFALNAFTASGTKVASFPKPTLDIGSFRTNSGAIADMDGDGFLELAWVDASFNLNLWDLTSTASGTLPWPMFQHDAQHTGRQPTIVVSPDVLPPTVSLTQPANNAVVSGTIQVSATANDNVGIAKVEFYRGSSKLLGTATNVPYVISWDTGTGEDGKRALTAVAHDMAGNKTTSGAVSVTIDNNAPKVTITKPANNAFVSRGATVTITVTASDAGSGVAYVEFFVQGIQKCKDTTSSYTCSWKVPAGAGVAYKLQAKAVDRTGKSTSSSIITVTSK
jgi:hypothetical protein